MVGRIEMGRHGADDLVAHAVEHVVVGHVARADDLDAGLVEAALEELLTKGAPCRPARTRRWRPAWSRPRAAAPGEVRVGERKRIDSRICPPALMKASLNDPSESIPGA